MMQAIGNEEEYTIIKVADVQKINKVPSKSKKLLSCQWVVLSQFILVS
jgi:hypothetical protein